MRFTYFYCSTWWVGVDAEKIIIDFPSLCSFFYNNVISSTKLHPDRDSNRLSIVGRYLAFSHLRRMRRRPFYGWLGSNNINKSPCVWGWHAICVNTGIGRTYFYPGNKCQSIPKRFCFFFVYIHSLLRWWVVWLQQQYVCGWMDRWMDGCRNAKRECSLFFWSRD